MSGSRHNPCCLPHDHDHFLTLAIELSHVAQAEMEGPEVQARAVPRWTDALAAALPVVIPEIAFSKKCGASPGFAAFVDAAAALCGISKNRFRSAIVKYMKTVFFN